MEFEIEGLNFANSKLSYADLSNCVYFDYNKPYLPKKKLLIPYVLKKLYFDNYFVKYTYFWQFLKNFLLGKGQVISSSLGKFENYLRKILELYVNFWNCKNMWNIFYFNVNRFVSRWNIFKIKSILCCHRFIFTNIFLITIFFVLTVFLQFYLKF